MRCFYFSVCKFSVLAQNVSHKDGFQIHARKSYRSSSPTPKALGDTRHFLTKPKQCCLFCTCPFLSIPGFIQHPQRIRVYSPLWVNYPQFFSSRLLSRHWVCCSEWGVCNSICLSFASLPKRIPTAMGFEPTHGNRIGLAVQRLNHSATLSLFIDKSQKLLSILHFSFSLHYQICPTSSN